MNRAGQNIGAELKIDSFSKSVKIDRDFFRSRFYMSNNTTIILLWFDWSNIKLFEPIHPRLASIKLHFDSMMTLLMWFWPQVSKFTLQTPIPVQGEKKRQDLTATAPREQPKLQALTPEIDWLCVSWLKHEAEVTQTLHFGCPCSQYPSASTSHTYRHTSSLLH